MNPLFDFGPPVSNPQAQDRATVAKTVGKNRSLSYKPPTMHEVEAWLGSSGKPTAHSSPNSASGMLWQLYHELLELCQDACLVTDPTGEILDCNPRAVEIFGMPAESLRGLSLPRLIDPVDWEPVQARLPELLAHGKHLATEICVHPPDGSMRFAAITLARVPDVMQRALLVWVIRDVTEQNRIEEGLRASKERVDGMETVLQQSVEGVMIRDVAGRVVFANDTAARALNSPYVQLLLGATIEYIQKTYVVLDEFGNPLHPELLPQFRAEHGERSAVGVIGFRALSSGEEQWWGVQAICLHDMYGHVQSFAHRFRDITVERRSEHDLRTLRKQFWLAKERARQAETGKETAVQNERSRLANEIHDTLAQSLSAISLHLEAAKGALNIGDSDALALISRAGSIARECLGETRRSIWTLRPHILESCTLNEALAKLAGEADAGSNSNVMFCEMGESAPLRPSTESALLRICQEALTNALVHASPDNIRIYLSWTRRNILLRVKDDGCGIGRSKQREGGFGLIGMSERAEIAGGRVRVRSRCGKGTCVFVRIPRDVIHSERGTNGQRISHSRFNS